MTKTELIAQLKAEYPTLKRGSDEDGYEDLSKSEYDKTISDWADAMLLKEAEDEKLAALQTKKQEVLAKLGLDADEISALLA